MILHASIVASCRNSTKWSVFGVADVIDWCRLGLPIRICPPFRNKPNGWLLLNPDIMEKENFCFEKDLAESWPIFKTFDMTKCDQSAGLQSWLNCQQCVWTNCRLFSQQDNLALWTIMSMGNFHLLVHMSTWATNFDSSLTNPRKITLKKQCA